MLLDLDDPSKVLGSLAEPLLTPIDTGAVDGRGNPVSERDGYVPNVVYSCGALLHKDTLTIPYGISDGAIGFAQIDLPDLLRQLH
jgi:predicted GH43/DUF377 family glycosyl hydrolase